MEADTIVLVVIALLFGTFIHMIGVFVYRLIKQNSKLIELLSHNIKG